MNIHRNFQRVNGAHNIEQNRWENETKTIEVVNIFDVEGHVFIEGDILSSDDILPEEKAKQTWPDNQCSICGHLFSDDYLLMLKVGEASPNCPECDARPRVRTLPMLMHYLQPLTARIYGGE